MALDSMQLLRKMCSREISWGLKGLVLRVDNLAAFMCRVSRNYRSLKLLYPRGLVKVRIAISVYKVILSVQCNPTLLQRFIAQVSAFVSYSQAVS
jgi:hypothetical protein